MILAGQWVRLEPLGEEHREPLRLAADDDRIWEHMTILARGPGFDEWFDTAIRQHRENKRVPWAVFRKTDGTLIGSTSFLDPLPEHKRVEIGSTWYRPDAWTTAVNPECKLLLMTHAFETLGWNRVQYVTDIRNERSQAAIAKLGAKREGVLRSHMISRNGRIRDSVVFAITKDEWSKVKERLMLRLRAFDGPSYDEEAEMTAYLWRYNSRFFTKAEHEARAAMHIQGVTAAGSKSPAKRIVGSKVGNHWAVPIATSDESHSFLVSAAKRVLADSGHLIHINRCPRCNYVVRTPQAKQCFWCGHDWHS